ncbi:glycosyltransferase family 2 protein [Desulfosediminicola ganghwensis]|uniref:glycosyltransferase family 2 protein n=1 Tax=Desulfosediminicola ganghwensis TaxID=2569540 RepID=UPI0010ABFD1B|nr:glycosyltransferase [Desulfosediminicola ganghwensis]
MVTPLISVVIPAYNHERYIGAAVESVLQQTFADLELIVIDDGSTDRTGEIVQSYDDKRLTYLFQENRDAYNTLNRGMGLAKGEYISILNSDDVYAQNRLEKLLAHQKESDAACIFTDVIPVSDTSIEFTEFDFGWNIWHRKNRQTFFDSNDLYASFLKGNLLVTTSNLFMTTKAQQEVGLFTSLRYLHDYDFIFRMMMAYPKGVSYLHNERLLYYRIHSKNTLGEAAITGREQDKQVILKYMLARLPREERKYAEAGASRLMELEQELQQVKTVLQPDRVNRGVRPAAKALCNSLSIWLQKKVHFAQG